MADNTQSAEPYPPSRDPACFIVRIRARPGMGQEVLAALQDLVPEVHAEPGCERYALHAADGQDTFVSVERWTSANAARTHVGSPAVRRYREWVAGLTEPSEITQLTPIALGDAEKGLI